MSPNLCTNMDILLKQCINISVCIVLSHIGCEGRGFISNLLIYDHYRYSYTENLLFDIDLEYKWIYQKKKKGTEYIEGVHIGFLYEFIRGYYAVISTFGTLLHCVGLQNRMLPQHFYSSPSLLSD